MTKREYIEICKRLWMHISKVNSPVYLAKQNWPEWKSNGGNIPNMNNNCPCCQYREDNRLEDNNRQSCAEICPLKGLWTKKKDGDVFSQSCMDGTSPYQRWVRAVTQPNAVGNYSTGYQDEARKAAKQMVRICNKALKALDKGE